MKARPRAELLLDNIGQLLTLEPEQGEGRLGIIRNAAVAIGDGRILNVGSRSTIEEGVAIDGKTRRHDVGGHVVLPGL